jgi:hypothetical protein
MKLVRASNVGVPLLESARVAAVKGKRPIVTQRKLRGQGRQLRAFSSRAFDAAEASKAKEEALYRLVP